MSTINLNPLSVQMFSDLLTKFPVSWQEKLKAYTVEELFYFYKLCQLKPKRIMIRQDDNSFVDAGMKDMFFLSLRAKFYRYMQGKDKYLIHGDAWIKLHHKFRHSFDLYTEELTIENEKTLVNSAVLASKFNKTRLA